MAKFCCLCTKEAVRGEKYCRSCRKLVLQQMRTSGYLSPKPQQTKPRGDDEMEDTRETKYGPP